MTEERGRRARGNAALVGRVLVRVLRLRVLWILGRRQQQSTDVDDPLQLADAVKEIQHRVVRTVQFDIEKGEKGPKAANVQLVTDAVPSQDAAAA